MTELFDTSSLGNEFRAKLQGQSTLQFSGKLVQAIGTSVRVSGLPVRIGQRCEIHDRLSGTRVLADVIGIKQGDAILIPLGDIRGIATESTVRIHSENATVAAGTALLGRVIDGFGQALDDKGEIDSQHHVTIHGAVPNPLQRSRITEQLKTGIRSIDTLLSVGIGQRLGIFAPAGVGKSTLLGMLAMHTEADVIVVGLIGERGREVKEFLEDSLNESARSRAVICVATSDRPAMERINAALTATAIAESFRDEGLRVLLLMDSITRYARAVREVGLAVGEPPVRQGYPPSVFAELPRLFERAGNNSCGSVTAFYTVLTDDDDGLDPIAEETRSILDGHIVLSRKIAEKNRFPAIDVLTSLSRLARQLQNRQQQEAAAKLRRLMAKHREIEFLLQVGEYEKGSDAEADEAITRIPAILDFLCQQPAESISFRQGSEELNALLGMADDAAELANRAGRSEVQA